ncbi:MAG TPA: DNA mismatch endonuclease Vsr [Mucilaginibacter sp.]|jgi:DNA mismatch endonuclease (patch repair protein)
MADVLSKESRSFNMSRIRSKDTKPELFVRRFLHKNGFRYKLHVKELPGKPDIVMPKYKTIIFIHGCFWHGHGGCKYFTIPKTNTDYWTNKIQTNINNYEQAKEQLFKAGWKIITIWECDLKNNIAAQTLHNLVAQIQLDLVYSYSN